MKRTAIAILASCVIVLGAGSALAQDDERNDPEFQKYEKKLVKQADEIMKWVSKYRGLEYQAPVPKGVATDKELKKLLEQDFDKPENVKEAEKDGQVARAFGLIPENFDFRKEMRDLLAEQIGGFYDPEAKRLRLVKKKMMEGIPENAAELNDAMVMAHELEHALQDQNFDLKRWEAVLDGHTDRSQALKCVVEGEATIVGFKYMFEKMGMPAPDMKSIWQMQNQMGGADPNAQKMESLPAYLTKNLLMSYEEGSIFVETVYDKGGWAAVSKLFQEPPSSTAQILHPKKYFDHVEPKEISMPPLAKLMKGTEIDQSTWGEQNVRLILGEHGQKKKAARTIAAGWAGDRYQVILAEDKKTICAVWLTTWEDEDKATAFETAYREGLKKRRGDKFSLERKGTEVLLVDCDDAVLRGKVASKAWLSAFDTGHLAPFKPMLEKPPTTDFTNPDLTDAFGGPEKVAAAAVLGEILKDEDLGFSVRLPKDWKKEEESINALKGFSRGLWKSKGGAELRIVDLPMPWDKDTLTTQFETLVKRGTKEYKKRKESARQLGGHEAMMVEFEGILPDGSEEAREAQAVAVERDSMTLLVILSAKKGGMKAEEPVFEAALQTLRFVPHAIVDEKTLEWKNLALPMSKSWKDESSDDGVSLKSRDGQATITAVVTKAPSSDLEDDKKRTESLRAKNLKGYKALESQVVDHDYLGRVCVSDYEVEGKDGGKRHVRELVALKDGLRVQLTCASDADGFDKHRSIFERTIAGVKLSASEKKPEKTPEKKPEKKKDDDEPF